MSQGSDEIRRSFLEFFRKNDHEVAPSGPVIAPNDPSLMFANAGMVQFKDVFVGAEQRDYARATSSQKCIRIKGKHNDLENVGPSPRHHTFFEMLGNFSFGDYFKEEAIVYAWKFLVEELGLPKERLMVSYFGGDRGIAADDDAKSLWRKISGLSEDRIVGCDYDENFWSMGDTGPCGPCSEIHYYQGDNPDPSKFGAEQTEEGFGWVEIWNLVFMQFERQQGGELQPLPRPSIDTGMGLERISAVLQHKSSNYDTDLLRALVDKAAQFAGKPYGGTMQDDDVSMRVIADHSRTTAFLLAEGVMPDKNEREYVLRRVIRRAVRHGHRLGIGQPFLHEVALEVVKLMGEQYPELRERSEHIAKVTEQEEVRFRRTIERGLTLLDERFGVLEAKAESEISGEDAFKLHDTYGFPVDLTQVICRERGFTVDMAGYDKASEEARALSEFKSGGKAVAPVYSQVLERVPLGAVQFSGYERNRDRAQLVAIIEQGQLVDTVAFDESSEDSVQPDVELVFARTPFYGESGGQVGDTGTICTRDGQFEVADVQRPLPDLVVHHGRLSKGTLSVGDDADLYIDVPRRNAIRSNHSATHLLHWALRQVLGSHTQQKGSLVGPERLRFDFTHGEPLTRAEIEKIEDLVNERIRRNAPVRTEVLGIEQAKERGAMMLFGEKYAADVRVLTMTDSVELCGGTHARATGDIGLLKIVAEQGVSAGVRRLTAATGQGAIEYSRELESVLQQAARLVKAGHQDLGSKLEKMLGKEKALEKQIAELQKKLAQGGGGGLDPLLAQAREVNGVKALGIRTEVTDRAALRELAEQLRDKLGDSIVLVASEAEGKAQLVLTVTKRLASTYPAGQLIRPLAAIVGGSGGGRPDMAQAGGTEVSKLDEAVSALYQALED